MNYLILYVSITVFFMLSRVFFSAADVQQRKGLKYTFMVVGKVLSFMTLPAVLAFFTSPWLPQINLIAEVALYIMTSALTMALVCSAISKVTKWRFM